MQMALCTMSLKYLCEQPDGATGREHGSGFVLPGQAAQRKASRGDARQDKPSCCVGQARREKCPLVLKNTVIYTDLNCFFLPNTQPMSKCIAHSEKNILQNCCTFHIELLLVKDFNEMAALDKSIFLFLTNICIYSAQAKMIWKLPMRNILHTITGSFMFIAWIHATDGKTPVLLHQAWTFNSKIKKCNWNEVHMSAMKPNLKFAFFYFYFFFFFWGGGGGR